MNYRPSDLLIPEESFKIADEAVRNNSISNWSQIRISALKSELLKLRADLLTAKEKFDLQTVGFENEKNPFLSKLLQEQQIQQVPPQQRRSKNAKTSGNPRNSLQRTNSQRTEISQRAQTKLEKAVIEDPHDIWYCSQPIFRPLPQNHVIEEIFQVAMPMQREKPKIKEHWAIHLMSLVQNSPAKPMLANPPLPTKTNDIAKYWKSHSVPFQIEKAQKYNRSTLHGLLASLIRTDPIVETKTAENTENQEHDGDNQNNEDANDIKKKNRRNKHLLAPHIPYHSYFSLSFDERLELELKSLQLDKDSIQESEEIDSQENSITQVGKAYQSDLEKNAQDLIPIKNYIMDNLDKFREKEKERFDNIDKTQRLIIIEKSKKKN